MWFLLAAGAIGLASVLPQTRDKAKDVPWMPIAVIVGLGFLGDGIKSIGTETIVTSE